VFLPCPNCEGEGYVDPPKGQVGLRNGKLTCKTCNGSGDELRRVSLSEFKRLDAEFRQPWRAPRTSPL
jgi:hypothetical protein